MRKLLRDDWDEGGEWEQEPEMVVWIDKDTKYTCAIIRNENGCFCGYVGIKKDHPLFQRKFSDRIIEEGNFTVHGDINYSGQIKMLNKDWWFGFDCCHGFDFVPAFDSVPKLEKKSGVVTSRSPYRNLQYTRKECEKLARQLKEFEALQLNQS